MIERLNKGSQGLQIRMNFSELFQTGVDFFILGIIWHFFSEKYLQKTQKNTLQIMFWIENYTPSPPGPFSLEKLKDSSESAGLGFPKHDNTEISAWHVVFNLTNHERGVGTWW